MPQRKLTEQDKKEIAGKVHDLRTQSIEWQFIYHQFGISQPTCKKIYRAIYKEKAI